MSNDDISSMLRKLDELANITPSSVRHGLNKQQRGAPQLPAEFQPGQISVLANRSDPEHPARKFFVGAESRDPEIKDTGESYFVAMVTREPTLRVQRTKSALPYERAMQLARRLSQSSKFARKPFVTIYPQGQGKPSADELLSQYQNIAEGTQNALPASIKNIIAQDMPGGATEKRILNKFLGSGLWHDGMTAEEFVPTAHEWLQKNKAWLMRDIKKTDPQADLSSLNDVKELANQLYTQYLARTDKLEEGLREFVDAGGGDDDSDDDQTQRIIDMFKKDGMSEKEIADAEGITELKVHNIIAEYERRLKESMASTNEDVLSNIKKRLGDYLEDVAKAIRHGDVLGDKVSAQDSLANVKTITTDDGKVIQIRGNADDGFRISVKNKMSETVFASLGEAETAINLYNSRRTATSPDYKEESK